MPVGAVRYSCPHENRMVVERVVNRLRWGTAQNMGRGEVSTTAFADPTVARMLTLMAAKHASPPSGEDFEFDMLTEFLRFLGKCTVVEQCYSVTHFTSSSRLPTGSHFRMQTPMCEEYVVKTWSPSLDSTRPRQHRQIDDGDLNK